MSAQDNLSTHQFYLRFGDWPANERSFSPAGGYHEDGVSVYDLDHNGNPVDPDPEMVGNGNDTLDEMHGRVQRAERTRASGRDNPREVGHLVRGEMVGIGYDGEPLLRNVEHAGDWINQRHKKIPGAPRHRLAPSKEDKARRVYTPPEE